MNAEVRVRREATVIPTYEPATPDRNPMFLEKRVYQGSSGRVYPLPIIDRIAERPTDRNWDAIYLENGLVEVMLLPEIGGRIHAGRDLTNGYEFFYRQHVIKPALVGLAGPWASGGVEFNWPQHHRPSTFMPTDVEIEHAEDGSITVWMSEHDPMNRLKGMHGVCLHPGRSVVELKVRLYNRTPYVHTFLWWTNIGTHVHEAYQSFFPPDCHAVADHAKRAISGYPRCEDRYYGVDYGGRGRNGVPADEIPSHFVPANSGGEGPLYAPNDLSWYANIPVPTSYMCLGTKQDFVGGYDGFREAGLMHVADHHIAPGKKQWTWGNQEFGYAWDRNLTDSDGPYIELMAGVYTDNQPDFSYLGPGETKVFSQFWYPYQGIGPALAANVDAALSLTSSGVGAVATRSLSGVLTAFDDQGVLHEWRVDLAPDRPFRAKLAGVTRLSLVENGKLVVEYADRASGPTGFPAAVEPPLPQDVTSSDQLFLIGQHLEQYRHATRSPADYWREALRRDAGDSRCNLAMGRWHFHRGEFELARGYFDRAIARSVERNPNPYDGEPYYYLGLVERFLGNDEAAIDAFAKSVWNSAWQAPGYHALGEMACRREDWGRALDYLDRSIRKDADNFRAHCLRAIIRSKLGLDFNLDEVLRLDPLDHWARSLAGKPTRMDNATRLDLVIDLMRAGLTAEALEMLGGGDPSAADGTAPMLDYYEAFLRGTPAPSQASPDYCFPSRLEDIRVLEFAPANDARAAFFLGNLLYDRRRHEEAIANWERAVALEPANAVAWRNLGIGYFNVRRDPEAARRAYEQAIAVNPDDVRYLYERDQLWKRTGVSPADRLAELERHPEALYRRDDLAIEYCSLLNAVGARERAAEVLASRRFQPWEGGEGLALGIYSRTHLGLGRAALERGDAATARAHFESVLRPPHHLGEARHLLANASDLWLALGDADLALGNADESRRWWTTAADFRGDFQEMSTRTISESTYFQILAMRRLGRIVDADLRIDELEAYARQLAETEFKIDYFATSLPTILLFEDDLQARQDNTARFLLAQAMHARGRLERSRELIDAVLAHDPNHALAQEFLRSFDKQAGT